MDEQLQALEDLPGLVGLRDFSRVTGMGYELVKKEARAGKLPGQVVFGKRVMVPRGIVKRLISGETQKQLTPVEMTGAYSPPRMRHGVEGGSKEEVCG